MKFNKTIKLHMVHAAISDKFEKQYDEYLKKLATAARQYLIKESLHESIISKLNIDELSYVRGRTCLSFNNSISVKDIPFTNGTFVSQVNFEPVYGTDVYYVGADELKELDEFNELVYSIRYYMGELTPLVTSYTKVKDLFADLPWIEQYYPEQVVTGTSLIAKDVIDSINVKFG